MTLTGSCHCGAVKAAFDISRTPAELGVRACQCSFCRRHGAVNTSDPEGKFTIEADVEDVHRYRFGLRTADFVICRRCGVYVAAVMGSGGGMRSTANVAGLRMQEFLDLSVPPIVYEAETTEDRIARRRTKWTPTRFTDPLLAASYFGPH
jgi:hypothetical protein